MKRAWMVLVAVLAVAAAAWVVLHVGTPGASPGPDRESTAVDKAASDEKPPAGPQARVEDRPLPPVDLPLAAAIGDLKRRADRGEAGAACRLAAEWTYCRGLRQRLRGNEDALRAGERNALRFAPGGDKERTGVSAEAMERGLDYLQAQVERSKSQLAHCDGVPEPRPDEVARYWRQAALAGHLPSMRNYAVGNAFRRDEVLHNLPALEVYRREAVRIARAAVARGDLRTAIALAGAYSPQGARNTYLAQLVDPDASEALALAYRIDDAFARGGNSANQNLRSQLDGMIDDLETAMSPTEIREAERRAGNSPALAAGPRELQGLAMVARGFVADVPREECDLAAWSKQP